MSDDDIDAARYPSIAHYLAGLPDGLASHPDCFAKASLHRSVLSERPLGDLGGLPAVLADLAQHPRPVNTWVPEVHSHAIMLAVCDQVFGSADRFLEFAYEAQRRLWKSKIYAVLMAWSSPQRLISTASQRWTLFHRGSSLRVESIGDGRARLRLAHPVGLYDAISRGGLTQGLRAALGMSTRYRCTLEELDASPTTARWAATWTEL